MSKIDTVIPPGLEFQHDRFHYAPAVVIREAGSLVVVSGVIGGRVGGDFPADPSEQFQVAFENLATVLEHAGSSLAHVVELITFHLSLKPESLGPFIAAKDAVIGAPYPAWTAVGVTELADPRALVEVRAMAVLAA
jgi:enamine deaminase RidA (YjgF/YER057c/UK114 family)